MEKISQAEAVRERRKMMLKFHFRGVPTTTWVAELAKKYGVEEVAIWQDWRRRKSWLGKVFDLSDVENEINMNMAELMNVKEEAWKTYHTAANAQSKAAALKIIARSIKDKIEILQSLGEVKKAPLRVELKGKIDENTIKLLLKQYAEVIERVAKRDLGG